MGTKIKFRGAYEPYEITGSRPYDDTPVRPRPGPPRRKYFPCNYEGLICSSCSKSIQIGQMMYRTKKRTNRHQQC